MRIDIRVPEVRSLLGDTGADLEDLEAERTRLADAASRLQESVTGCAGRDTGILRVHEDVFRPDATDIMIRCNNAVQGTGQAESEQIGDEKYAATEKHHFEQYLAVGSNSLRGIVNATTGQGQKLP